MKWYLQRSEGVGKQLIPTRTVQDTATYVVLQKDYNEVKGDVGCKEKII
jgi:hypothetical protein